MSKIQPVNDYILIEPEKAEEKTASGIFIPDTADKEKPQKAKVVAVGPGKLGKDGKREELSVKAGDVILYSKYGPTEVKLGKDEYFFIQESDVIAIIKEAEAEAKYKKAGDGKIKEMLKETVAIDRDGNIIKD